MITGSKKIKKILEQMYDVANVKDGYTYWYLRLLEFTLSIFRYEGLPETLPARELELQLITQGYATPFRKDNGDIVSIPSCLYGYDEYYTPTCASFGNPLIRTKRLYLTDVRGHEQNAVLMYNSELHNNLYYANIDGSFNPLLCRYARRLADLESSENIYTVKTRCGKAPASGSDATNNSVMNFLNKIVVGDFKNAIADDAVLTSFRSVEMGNDTSENLMSFQAARDKILEQFFREIGVKFYNSKKAQVTEEEVQADEQVLLISLKNVLRERTAGIERFNEFFGTNARVYINEEYQRENIIANNKEGEKNNVVSV